MRFGVATYVIQESIYPALSSSTDIKVIDYFCQVVELSFCPIFQNYLHEAFLF